MPKLVQLKDNDYIYPQTIPSVELYNNPAGSDSNITLNDNFSNYRYIDILISCMNGQNKRKSVVRVYNMNIGIQSFETTFHLMEGNSMNVYYRSYDIDGLNIRVGQSYMWSSTGYVGIYTSHYITKVLGYK